MTAACLLAAAIQLAGVEGNALRARTFLDANNVKVGDPLVLTVDFIGEADFAALHPPALSRHVNRRDWKLDDASAKTDTYRDARRLTYRIRPMREGVLWFPALEFEYRGADGATRTVRSNEVPVHARAGAAVEVAEMREDPNRMPEPDALVTGLPDGTAAALSDDERFAWRKACANPTADGFAAFDFPEARLNEAACAIRDGNWARALRVYSRLEWRIGQTPAVERGIVAALALRYENPAAELPVWRQVLRPVLRFGWQGRVGVVGGALAALALLFALAGRLIRAVAALAVCALLLPQAAAAQDIFERMEQMMERQRRQMQQMTTGGGFGFHFGEKEVREVPKVEARAATSKGELQVGDEFEFILSLEAPRTASIGQVRITPSQMFGMTVTGRPRNLTDGPCANPSNVVRRLSFPVRYDVPFKGSVSFQVDGMVTGRQASNERGGLFSFSFSNSFVAQTPPVEVDIRPLPAAGQPAGFSGIIAPELSVFEYPDLLKVETNDVITITYRMKCDGYVPEGWMPEGAAFEWGRENGVFEFRRFFVADGKSETPVVKIVWYDPQTKSYRTARTGGSHVSYK